MKKLSDYIVVIDEAITDALCDSVLNEYKNCEDWLAATTAAGKTDAERQCHTIGISFEDIINKNKKCFIILVRFMELKSKLYEKEY
jgi:hypothetical protein